MLFLPTASDWMLKSKLTPICSKKLSLTVMNGFDRDLKVLQRRN